MTKKTTLAAAIVLSLLATSAFAQQGAQAKPERAARMNIDSNGDGVIDRAEAAKFPRLAARFDQLDRNGDGRLDANERPRRGAHGRHGRGDGRHGRAAGPERLDSNGDGRLSREEVAAGRGGRGGSNRLVEHFDAIDGNRDGHIDRAELRNWHERQRPQREAEMRKRFDERFAAADLNRDGKLSRVEVDEKMPRLTARFAWMDENRDGFLSREELQPRRGR